MKLIRKLKELLNSRVTGVSTPFGGVEWEYGVADNVQAQNIVDFLSNRRVLFNDVELEVPRFCVESVHKIRQFLTDTLQDNQQDTPVRSCLLDLLGACRKFDDTITQNCPSLQHGHLGGQFFEQVAFFTSLGELRGAFGVQLAFLKETYNSRLTPELSRVLPAEADPPRLLPPWLNQAASKRLRKLEPPIKEAMSEVAEEYATRGLKLDSARTFGSDLPRRRFNFDQIVDLFELLLRFAAKYSNQGSHVVLSTSIDKEAVAVHVEYTGISLQGKETRELIFRPEGVRSPDVATRVSVTEESLWKCKKLAEFNSATIRYDVKRRGDRQNDAICEFTVTFHGDTEA
ncbi:hypothetical protein FJZ31_06765 [Candidatus Poribacteria bacterium]|nr:hypothetical protein [Candidatus Poribacteria bacterium]